MTEFTNPNSRILKTDAIKEYGHNYHFRILKVGEGTGCIIQISEGLGKSKDATHGSFKLTLEAALEAYEKSPYESYDVDPLSLPRQIDLPIVLKKGDPVFLVTKNGLEVDAVKDVSLVQADGDMGMDLASSGLTHIPTYVLESGRTVTPPARRIDPLNMADFSKIGSSKTALSGQDRTANYPLLGENDLQLDRAFFSPEAAKTWANSQAVEMQRIAESFQRQASLLQQTAWDVDQIDAPEGPRVVEL